MKRSLSPFGIRSLSRRHKNPPFLFGHEGRCSVGTYEPGEIQAALFGGNSTWWGPIWFPINYILIDALEKYHRTWATACRWNRHRVCNQMNLDEVARELRRRLLSLCTAGQPPPLLPRQKALRRNTDWRDDILFYEFVHADTGEGLGARHQTGWTGLRLTYSVNWC